MALALRTPNATAADMILVIRLLLELLERCWARSPRAAAGDSALKALRQRFSSVDLPAALFDATGGVIHRVLDLAGRVLDLALDLLGLAFCFHLGVAKSLAGLLLDAADSLLGRTRDPILGGPS